MHPVLASIGPFVLYTYTFLIDLGIAAGLGWLYLAAPRPGAAPQPARWLDAGIATTLGGLAGARLGYVFANWAYFGSHLGEAARLWEGGLAWPGAAAGGTLGLWLFCRLRGESFWLIADALTLPVVLLAALAWLGCAASACAPGLEVAPGALPAWFAVDWPDEFGVRGLRWPTQILGAAWSLLLLAAMRRLRDQRWAPGARPLLALAAIALGNTALALTRGDAMPLLAGARLDAVASGAVLAAAGVMLAGRMRSSTHIQERT